MSLARKLNQTVTYWNVNGTDRYGKPIFTAPATLSARWEDRTESVQGKGGDVIVSKARVYLSQAVNIDGYLFEGTSVAADPTIVRGAAEIQALGSMPNLRNTTKLYVAFL